MTRSSAPTRPLALNRTWKALDADPRREVLARRARHPDFEKNIADAPALTNQRVRDVQPLRPQILTDHARWTGPIDLVRPPAGVLLGVAVHRLVRTAMAAPQLPVPDEAEFGHSDRAAYWTLVDSCLPEVAPADVMHQSHIQQPRLVARECRHGITMPSLHPCSLDHPCAIRRGMSVACRPTLLNISRCPVSRRLAGRPDDVQPPLGEGPTSDRDRPANDRLAANRRPHGGTRGSSVLARDLGQPADLAAASISSRRFVQKAGSCRCTAMLSASVPTAPSSSSRRMSAWPACRLVSASR